MMKMADESAAKRRSQVVSGGFGGPVGGVFGVGVMPELTGIAGSEIAKRQRAMDQSAWGGGYGGMGSLEFARAAQESISRPKDETAKAQLDELKKIHAAITRQQGGRNGVILRGPA